MRNVSRHPKRCGGHLSVAQGLTVAASVLVLGGCAPSKVTIHASPELGKYQIRTVAMMPFDALSTPQAIEPVVPELPAPQGAKRSDIAVAVPPATERLSQATVIVPSYAAEKVTQIFFGKLQKWEGVRMLSPEQAARAVSALGPDAKGAAPEDLAKKVAARLSADAVLLGRVLVYQERVGSKLGASPPAAVGFEVKLVGADGVILWAANYYEKQRPLTEDFLGFVQHGGGFVTAAQLAEYGAERVIRSFPVGAPPR